MKNSFYENVVKDLLVPSLRHVTAVRIMRIFIVQPDMLRLLKEDIWRAELSKYTLVLEKISSLPLPDKLKDYLKYFIKPTLSNFTHWMKDHSQVGIVKMVENCGHLVVWSPRGEINYVETGKNLLADDTLPLCTFNKYKISCYYCLEEEVIRRAPTTWDPTYAKNVSPVDEAPEYYFMYSAPHNAEKLERWVRERGMSFSHFMIQSGRTKDTDFMKVMWGKCTEAEKASNLDLLIGNCSKPEFIFYFLLQCDEDQLVNVLRVHIDRVFHNLVEHPLWLEFALIFVFHYWSLLTKEQFDRIFENLFRRYTPDESHLCDRLMYIAEELWDAASAGFRQNVIHLLRTHYCLLDRASWERAPIFMEKLLTDLTHKKRHDLVYREGGLKLCADFIMNNQWECLNAFLRPVLAFSSDSTVCFRRIFEHRWMFRIVEQNEESWERYQQWITGI